MQFQFNIPLTKVDEERRLVYGLVTEQIIDQSGEILDYETSKAYFQSWSDGIAKATGGASLGNLRLMHQPVVAGKLTELLFDDVLKQISCVAKIVDDAVWNLVLEGCLTGFSMGGKYVKRWKDKADKAITWFTAQPVEVSVVDNPCVSTATFEYIKSDGSRELRKFHTAGDGEGENTMDPTQEEIAARALLLAKAAGASDHEQFLDEAKTLLIGEAELAKGFPPKKEKKEGEEDEDDADKSEDDADAEKMDEEEDTEKVAADARLAAAEQLVQVWQAPDGSTHAKKATAIDHILAVPVTESAVEKALRLAQAPVAPAVAAAPLGDLPARLETVAKGLVAVEGSLPEVAKGMYSVTSLSRTIEDFQWIVSCVLSESAERGEDSAVAGKLWEALTQMGEALIEMAQEEVAVLMAQLQTRWPTETLVVEVIELAALVEMTKANAPLLVKVGARNSGADQARIQVTHDNAVLLGATCDCETTNSVEDTDLVKGLRADIGARDTEIAKAIDGITAMGATIAELQEKVEKIGKTPQPLPPRSDHVVLERFGKAETIGQDDIEKMSPDQRADLAIRLSQMQPHNVGGR